MINNIDNQSSNTDAIRSLNSYHYGNIINLLRFLVLFLVVSLGGLSSFLGYLVFKQNRSDLVYFATLDGTYIGTKQSDATHNTRAPFEVENFSMRFIQDGFAHSENNYQENIERALTVMNNASRVTFKKLFSDDSLFQVYKESNGVTTVTINRIVSDTASYPYRTKVHFQTDLKFLTGQGKVKTHSYHQGIALAMQTTARCTKNPYGLIITDLTFLNDNEEK